MHVFITNGSVHVFSQSPGQGGGVGLGDTTPRLFRDGVVALEDNMRFVSFGTDALG